MSIHDKKKSIHFIATVYLFCQIKEHGFMSASYVFKTKCDSMVHTIKWDEKGKIILWTTLHVLWMWCFLVFVLFLKDFLYNVWNIETKMTFKNSVLCITVKIRSYICPFYLGVITAPFLKVSLHFGQLFSIFKNVFNT